MLTATVDRPFGYGRIVRLAGAHRANRRGARRVAGGTGDQRNQRGHLRVRARPAVRRDPQHRVGQCAGRVLPAGPGAHLPRSEVSASTTVTVENADEIRGINSRTELAEVERIVRQTEERRADGGRCDDHRPGDHLRAIADVERRRRTP